MSYARSSILGLACTALLVSQLSGLHMHVDADGYVGQPEGTHVHDTAAHRHDGSPGVAHADDPSPGHSEHEDSRDVPVVDPGAGFSKVLIVFPWVALGLVVVMARGSKLRAATRIARPSSRRERWRPPLRAPPLAASHSAS